MTELTDRDAALLLDMLLAARDAQGFILAPDGNTVAEALARVLDGSITVGIAEPAVRLAGSPLSQLSSREKASRTSRRISTGCNGCA